MRGTGSLKFWMATVILVLASVFFFAGTVTGGTNFDEAGMEAYYQEKEGQMVKQVREYLSEQGFSNSGIMLTRVVDGDSREYTLSVHHGKITRMKKEEQEVLSAELTAFGFREDGCSFFVKFLF